jgi:hypothetical protein
MLALIVASSTGSIFLTDYIVSVVLDFLLDGRDLLP